MAALPHPVLSRSEGLPPYLQPALHPAPGQFPPEHDISWPPGAKTPGQVGARPSCSHFTTFCPSAHGQTGKNVDSRWLRHFSPLDQKGNSAEVFAAKLYSLHTFATHQGAILPSLIQAGHIPHTSFYTCRPRYAHVASHTGILCRLQCSKEVFIFIF